MTKNYGVIPNYILMDNSITPSARVLYMAITSITDEKGCCSVTNSHIGKLLGINLQTVSNLIQVLKKKNYIRVDYINNQRFIYALGGAE